MEDDLQSSPWKQWLRRNKEKRKKIMSQKQGNLEFLEEKLTLLDV